MSSTLSLGDPVLWRGCFGTAAPRIAHVKGIVLTTDDNPKGEGEPTLPGIRWTLCKGRDVVLDLDNGSWCYGEQVSPAPALPCETCGGLPCLEQCS